METDKKEVMFRFPEKKIKLNVVNSPRRELGNLVKFKSKISLNAEDVRKVTVAVRIRPFNVKESADGSKCPFQIKDKEIVVNNGCSGDSSLLSSTFTYDNVFWSIKDAKYEYSDQKKVFDEIALPLLNAAIEGYNICLFAYGQTGSGKSYSMMGQDNNLIGDGAGIIPRFFEDLLKRHTDEKTVISMSYFEIYNEKIHDLLSVPGACDNKVSLRVREHPTEGPYVEGLSKHNIKCLDDVIRLLNLGNSFRATSATVHNNYSSRSHAILEVCIMSSMNEKALTSKVSLVDLAGSERVSQHPTTGEHFKEGLSINKSLLTLGKVITSLSDKKGCFIPYRESVLTWLLKESLGGNSRTVMLATISPSFMALEETLSTLRYACQARHILNKVVINEDPQLKLIRELKAEVDRLKSLHDHKKDEQSKIDGNVLKGIPVVSSQYVKYENELLNIEKAQKIVEEKLHAELSRVGLHLQAAERRRDELESQKFIFLEKIKNNDVSQYQSDFYQNLQELLNSSTPSTSIHDDESDNKEMLFNIENIRSSILNMKNICNSGMDNSSSIKKVFPLVERMSKCCQEIYQILNDSQDL